MLRAITREVSPSINDCELSFHQRQLIDVAKARVQHKAYQDCLATLGVCITRLPAEPELPDAVFVEDAAIVLDEVAVITNMGARSRRAEAASVAEALADYRSLLFLRAPSTLDGGDVLRIERDLFVGLSQRTNAAAIEQLRELLGPLGYGVHGVPMRGCLHLKSACSYVGEQTLLINRVFLDGTRSAVIDCRYSGAGLGAFDLLEVAEEEPGAANVLRVGDDLIMPVCFPKTRDLLEGRGFRVYTVDVSELQKAEAGVTCCSLIFREAPEALSKTDVAREA